MLASSVLATLVLASHQSTPLKHAAVRDAILRQGLTDMAAYTMLHDLCTNVGHRLSGSENAPKAIDWTIKQLNEIGADRVRELPCIVPRWVRGDREIVEMVADGETIRLSAAALGFSQGTSEAGLTAEVVEVKSIAQLKELGSAVKGKIVFFNRPFEQTLRTTFEMYGKAGDQRFAGPGEASKLGAVGALVRSMTLRADDEPHTGTTNWGEATPIPAVALSLNAADRLSARLKEDSVKVRMSLSCRQYPSVPSASVIGEIRGTEKPDDIIVVGGHLDSWDLGQGAHDDGAGITQALDVLRIFKKLNLKPKRTIRFVAFQNEENGFAGASTYAQHVKGLKERAYGAIESDSGGFMPRGFGAAVTDIQKIQPWLAYLKTFGITELTVGSGAADIGPLADQGCSLFGLRPDDARYFDVHHSRNDTIESVNPREVQFGAMAMAMLAWLISEEGVPE